MKLDIKVVISLIVLAVGAGTSWGYNKYRMDAIEETLLSIEASIKGLQEEVATDAVLQMSCDCYKDSKLEYERSRLGIGGSTGEVQ